MGRGRQPELSGSNRPYSWAGAEQCAFACARRDANQYAIAGLDYCAGCSQQRRTVGQGERDPVNHQSGFGALQLLYAVFAAHLGARVLDRVVESQQAVDRGFPGRKGGVRADEPGQRSLHVPECAGNLHQSAQLDGPRKIAVSGDEERKNDGRLVVTDGESIQDFLALHDQPPVVHDAAKPCAEAAKLVRLSAIKRDAFGILAKSYQSKPEVRLEALLIETQPDQLLADL